MSEGTVHARLNDGHEIPIASCNCARCSNEWFVPNYSPEWHPSFCPFCGLEFLFKTTGDEIDREKLRTRTGVQKWYRPEEVSWEIFDGQIWWHDDGEQIYPVNIAFSPTDNRFFATLGQWGWTRAQFLTDMGGRWMPCVEPLPDKDFRDE